MKNKWKGIRNMMISFKQSASPNIHLLYSSMKRSQTLKKLLTFLMITSVQ